MIAWKNEIGNLEDMIADNKNMECIGKEYGVSRQRIYQVLTKFGLSCPVQQQKNFLRDLEPKYYWLNKILCHRKFPWSHRVEILKEMHVPDTCPALGLKLDYEGGNGEGWRGRTDSSPSLDRINSDIGYTKGNIQIMSWRANRIKNDSKPEELLKIYEFLTR